MRDNVQYIIAGTLLFATVVIASFAMLPQKESFGSNPAYSDYNVSDTENDPTEGLIGLVYQPRLGPLGGNRIFPPKPGSVPHSFSALYDREPFLRNYN